MRLSEILGRAVVTTDGRALGTVHDVRLVQDPRATHAGTGFRVDALAVGRRAFGTRLGFLPGHVEGLGLLRRLLGHGEKVIVDWAAVVSCTEEHIMVDADLVEW